MTQPQHGTDAAPRRRLALAIAAVALIVSLAWGVIVAAGLWSDVQGFDRTDVPGELTVEIDETAEHVVYYERREWFASVPVTVDIDVTVTGPDGELVPVSDRDGAVNYRLVRLVGQSYASFDAPVAGTYTVTVTGTAPHDDASIAVGESITGTLLRDLTGPAILLVAGLVLAAVVAVTARR